MNNNYIEDADNELLAFPELAEIIQLEPEQSEQAWQITENIKTEKGKLQIYFQALALVAFEEWLQKREANLLVDRRQTSLLHPECAQVINVVCNLKVGDFKVCLIPTSSFSDEWVDIPQIAINSPDFAAHLYVVVGIDDELEVAGIKGFCTHDELANMTSKISVLPDGSYEINLGKFHQKTEKLLLHLHCLPPKDINFLPIPDSFSNYLQDFTKLLTQQAINAGLWIHNELDEFAQESSWRLLTPLSPMRKFQPTAAEDLEGILTAIDDMKVPVSAARSYCNLELAETKLRLYAITWCLPETEGNWSLLLILGAIQGKKSYQGIQLRVSDLTNVLDEQVLDSDNDYLFTQIEGNIEDKFLATITSADGKTETSVVFEFRPE